jgi:hypothetical protein
MFRTVVHVSDRKHDTIVKELRSVLQLYASRGLIVRDIHGDQEFECIRHTMLPIHMDICAADSHVGEI